MKTLALTFSLGLLTLGSAIAQEVPRFAFNLGAGFTEPVGNTGRNLDTGWGLQGGAGVNFGPYVGVMVDLGYNSLGINSTTLNNIGVPGGNVDIFSATLDPVVHLTPHRHFDIYITGGGGEYHWYQNFTTPAIGTAYAGNPFFGFYPVTYTTNAILASYSVNKPGVDAGAGIALGTKWHGKFYAEARYNKIFMGNSQHADYVPVTFGFRW